MGVTSHFLATAIPCHSSFVSKFLYAFFLLHSCELLLCKQQ